MSKKTWRVAGINFDHMHIGDLLRLVHEHPNAEIVGVCDEAPERMSEVIEKFGISTEKQFTDYRECLERSKPDVVVLCPKTGQHGEYVQKVAPYGVDILVEKPFAANLADADAMISAQNATGKQLVINWPLAWYPSHRTTKRLVDESKIGDVIEVHYYDGNRGPLRHIADKIEIGAEEAARQKSQSWWYQKSASGGALNDYLGYGVTLGTWFLGGKSPIEVTCVVDEPFGLEVDEHSITIAKYAFGVSKFETRWGTFTDPWTFQPQPKCGFVLIGTKGTISSYDYEPTIRVQTEVHPEGEIIEVDNLPSPHHNPIHHFLHCLETGEPIIGPLNPALCRIGQQIVDTAILSVKEKRTVPLLNFGF